MPSITDVGAAMKHARFATGEAMAQRLPDEIQGRM
jgi:hypothetical protein